MYLSFSINVKRNGKERKKNCCSEKSLESSRAYVTESAWVTQVRQENGTQHKHIFYACLLHTTKIVAFNVLCIPKYIQNVICQAESRGYNTHLYFVYILYIH